MGLFDHVLPVRVKGRGGRVFTCACVWIVVGKCVFVQPKFWPPKNPQSLTHKKIEHFFFRVKVQFIFILSCWHFNEVTRQKGAYIKVRKRRKERKTKFTWLINVFPFSIVIITDLFFSIWLFIYFSFSIKNNNIKTNSNWVICGVQFKLLNNMCLHKK